VKTIISRSRRSQVANGKSGEVSLRILLIDFHAKRTAKRDEIFLNFQSTKSLSMRDAFTADNALLVEILFFRFHSVSGL
jgi:hypothetical protein